MVEKLNTNELDDQSLNQILGLASKPELSADFEKRVMAAVAGQKRHSCEIVAFPRRPAPRTWIVGLPLAACLMVGVWLGANGQFSDILPVSSTTTTMASADQLSPSGVDDIENLSAGDQS
jgi:hypothetical protein